MNMVTLILFVLGFVLLVSGAELLVRGASRLALLAGISPLVVGLTVVAFGTSAPELFVSVQSGLSGQADIAVGNVVGSNIANILLILGLTATVTPLVVLQRVVRQEVPLMIGISFLLLWMSLDGELTRLDGITLALGIIVYLVFVIRQSRRERQLVEAGHAETRGGGLAGNTSIQVAIQVGFVAVGLILLMFGANWMINGTVAIARFYGISELVISLSIVAFGTSLPEIATSMVAGLRGERDIAVGNAIGSNIFNILLVLGVAAIVTPNGIIISSAVLRFDMPVMIAVAIICLPIFFTGGMIDRWEGMFFLGYYLLYLIYLWLSALQHPVLPTLSFITAIFIIPVTVLVLLISLTRTLKANWHNKVPSAL